MGGIFVPGGQSQFASAQVMYSTSSGFAVGGTGFTKSMFSHPNQGQWEVDVSSFTATPLSIAAATFDGVAPLAALVAVQQTGPTKFVMYPMYNDAGTWTATDSLIVYFTLFWR